MMQLTYKITLIFDISRYLSGILRKMARFLTNVSAEALQKSTPKYSSTNDKNQSSI
jgi:hypothetical protein